MNKKWIYNLARFLVVVSVCSIGLLALHRDWFRGLELLTQDARAARLAEHNPASDDIVVVLIDDRAMEAFEDLGWPWPYSVYTDLVKAIGPHAKSIAFDIIMERVGDPLENQDLADAIKESKAKVVCAGFLVPLKRELEEPDTEMNPFQLSQMQGEPCEIFPPSYAYDLPNQALMDNTDFLGHVTYRPEGQGWVLRKYLAVARVDDMAIPSLALAAVMGKLDLGLDDVGLDKDKRILLGDRKTVDLNENGEFRFTQHKVDHAYASVYDVLATLRGWVNMGNYRPVAEDSPPERLRLEQITPELFKDKIVLIGGAMWGGAGGGMDRKSTPANSSLAGLRVHAAAMQNLLDDQQIRDVPKWIGMLGVLFMGMFPFFLPSEKPWILGMIGFLPALLLPILAIIVANETQWMIPLVIPLSALLVSTGFLGGISWSRERRKRARLEEMEKVKQSFTDMLVHDLKGGISSITMSVSLLERLNPDVDEAPARVMNTMQTSSTRLLSQVNALLDIRKIEEGRMVLNQTPSSINDLTKNVVEEYRAAAEVAKLTLACSVDPSIKQAVLMDADIFRRIIDNLVWNALQYAKPQSTIEIGTKLHPSVSGEMQRVSLFVANLGNVIPPDQQKRVFRPFTSGNPEEIKNVRSVSTGLGLAFSRMATEAHDGEIFMESPWKEHGEGVKIDVNIPYRSQLPRS